MAGSAYVREIESAFIYNVLFDLGCTLILGGLVYGIYIHHYVFTTLIEPYCAEKSSKLLRPFLVQVAAVWVSMHVSLILKLQSPRR